MIANLARLFVAAVVGSVLIAGYTAFRIWDQGGRDDRRPADAIVVLGAAQYDGRPSPVFRARLEHAVQLYADGVAPVLVVTGGKAAGDRTTEAAAARRFAVSHGVPAEAIRVEKNLWVIFAIPPQQGDTPPGLQVVAAAPGLDLSLEIVKRLNAVAK